MQFRFYYFAGELCIIIAFIFFPVLTRDKHFCNRISWKDGTTWLQQFFLDPTQFWAFKLAWILWMANILFFPWFCFYHFLGLKLQTDKTSRSWTKINIWRQVAEWFRALDFNAVQILLFLVAGVVLGKCLVQLHGHPCRSSSCQLGFLTLMFSFVLFVSLALKSPSREVVN